MEVAIFGLGPIGTEYTRIFRSLGYKITAVGRSAAGCKRFQEATGITAHMWHTVASSDVLKKSLAVVAVGGAQLGSVTKDLIELGFARILVEKPGALGYAELEEVAALAADCGTDVRIAYNRRFYESVVRGMQVIEEDGGVRSMHFDFTEWSHRIQHIEKEDGVKERWFFHNSSHVVDLAFYMAGWPTEINTIAKISNGWHPYDLFVGSGRTDKGALFSYNADWNGPGRWQIEITTYKHRLIYRPLEELQVQIIGDIDINTVDLQKSAKDNFKHGFYNQVLAFLEGNDALPTIAEHAAHLTVYRQMCPGSE